MARTDGGPDRGGAPPMDEGWGTPVPGSRPIAGASPAGSFGSAGVDPAQPGADKQPGRGRTWLILLVSFATQLVVVLAAGNTYVVGKTSDYSRDHDGLLSAFAAMPRIFSWRLTPATGDRFHAYPAMLFGLLAFFVVAALLTLALVRGPITFWRAFVAVWLSVIVGLLAGGMVRRGVADLGGDKAVAILFRGSGVEVVAGIAAGLLAALVAAIVAVASRRPAEAVVPLAVPEPAPYAEPAAPPPWHGEDERPAAQAPSQQSAPSLQKPQQDDAQATTQFAAVPAGPPPGGQDGPPDGDTDGATTRLRRQDLGQYGPPTVVQRAEKPKEPEAPADDTEATQAMPAFPRPPDDEELGHHPDDD